MPIMFNSILREAGFRLEDIRLLRHADSNADRGRSPYDLWMHDRTSFERYQSKQTIENRKKLTAPYWAVFLADSSGKTMFAGLYRAKILGLLETDSPMEQRDGFDLAGSCDVYDLVLQESLSEFIGKLFIDWGKGALAWIQYPERQEKSVTELRLEYSDPQFPGFQRFIRSISQLELVPRGWIDALKSARGVYMLTCPQTREQYVGSATGVDGFWGRWQAYIQNGHGGNQGLMHRDPSDFQVSILEVAGSSASTEDILAMEGLWQMKLQSQQMGLNRNLAKVLVI